jgi:hypothetical protein
MSFSVHKTHNHWILHNFYQYFAIIFDNKIIQVSIPKIHMAIKSSTRVGSEKGVMYLSTS